MTIAPETLMAYADGELDPLTARRVEKAIAEDPALAAEVERHRRLRARIAGGFAGVVEEPVPDRLAALVRENNVVALPRPVQQRRWVLPIGIAASLALGLGIGSMTREAPVVARNGALYASADLASALDRQVGGEVGAVRVAVSFRDRDGGYCRVFAAPVADGIACRDDAGWALRRTQPGTARRATGGYAQAGSGDADLMAAAQDMMSGEPLDVAGEQAARAAGWQSRRP